MAQPRSHTPPTPESGLPPEKKPRLDGEGSTRLNPIAIAVEDESPTANSPKQNNRKKATVDPKTKADKFKARKHAKWLKTKKKTFPDPCSSEDVLWREIQDVLGEETVKEAIKADREFNSPYDYEAKEEVEVDFVALSSDGDALGLAPGSAHPWVIVAPFCLPGERARVRVYRNERLHSRADLIELLKPNLELRDDSLVKCKYFNSCAGCQYQMLPYQTQLDFKRNVIVKAYKNFSKVPATSVPDILPTMESPLQYGYRTKLTPHFQVPPKKVIAKIDKGDPDVQPDWLKIGFNKKGMSQIVDIEECPIATPVINERLPSIRKDVIQKRATYSRGATLLLRDSLDASFEQPVCVTQPKEDVWETVNGFKFTYNAASFFQNNNSVLPVLVDYVKDAITSASSSTTPPTHLIDAYCGSGLFAITLSPFFAHVRGIEISDQSVSSAERNVTLNGIPPEKVSVMKGDAAKIFDTVRDFPAGETVLLMDPPRKGSDGVFLEQVRAFGPRVVVYVSCNVHTQARDLGTLVGDGMYQIESIRGFDLFPQTAHVESVAVLTKAG